MDAGWQRVAARIDSERVRRGHLSLTAFARATGLGKSTIDKLVHARRDSYDPATIAVVEHTLEHTLGWQPGSIDRIRRGLGPIYDTDPDLTALIDVWPKLSPGTRTMLRILATEAAKVD